MTGDHYVGKPSATGQPRILKNKMSRFYGSLCIDEMRVHLRLVVVWLSWQVVVLAVTPQWLLACDHLQREEFVEWLVTHV